MANRQPHRQRHLNYFRTQYISEELGFHVDIGPGPNRHTWGAALLSKFPIVNSTHYLLPSPRGELAPAIHATLNMWGTLVNVIVSHNGQEEDVLDRELQSYELARIMREAYPQPFLFLGYVVTRPHEQRPGPYRILVEDGKMLDIDPSDHDRWCEYILFRGIQRLGYARVTRGSTPAVTDTELQIGLFKVPPMWIDVDPDQDFSLTIECHPIKYPRRSDFLTKLGPQMGIKDTNTMSSVRFLARMLFIISPRSELPPYVFYLLLLFSLWA